MRLLWIVNMVLPPLAKALGIKHGLSGTWMYDICEKLNKDKDVEFAVACVYGKSFRKVICDNTTYYCLPGNGKDMMFYNKSFIKYWKNVVEDFKPDIVNIHGTEYTHALSFVRTYADKIPTVISLQGVLSAIKDKDLGGLTKFEILKNKTLKEWIKFNGILENHYLHVKNAKSENEMLNKVNHCIVVDNWHHAMAYKINPKLKVYRVDYNLRENFYSAEKWNIDKIERYSITTNPGGTALKGLHVLLKAVYKLKKEYPNVKVKVPGMSKDGKNLCVTSGYSKYISKLIKKLQLQDNVVFLGSQTSEQIEKNLLSSHVLVVPSSIEGPSLILREGMHLGVPTIASFRGGMADFINDKVNGCLFDFCELDYLVLKLKQIFDDDNFAQSLSKSAIEKCVKAHDRQKNYSDYIRAITEILENE